MDICKALHIQNNDKEKYAKIISALGLDEICKCLPFTETEIKKAYQTDKRLNNLPISKWDEAAGFYTGKEGEYCLLIRSKLTDLMHRKFSVNGFICSQNVCILKNAAIMKYCTE